MKNVLLIAVTTAAVFILAACDPFTTSYERIDDSEFRLLDFIYEPADASPGDTVTLTAVFAGKNIDGGLNNYLEWKISFNVIRDMFGSQTIVETVSLDNLIKRGEAGYIDTSFSDITQTAAFWFIIPKDIVKKSGSILENWTDVLRTYTDIEIPEQFASLTKSQLVDMIDSVRINKENSEYFELFKSIPNTQLSQLLQFFTVPIRVSARIEEEGKRPHTILSNQSVRYNRLFREIYKNDTIPHNRNPVVDSVVVYKVKGEDRIMFNSKNNTADSTFLLYSKYNTVDDPAIEIEKGYTYFIEAASGSKLDYTTTTTGKRVAEKHHANWQFRLDPEETKNVKHSDYMDFRSVMDASWSIVPPKDKRITKFTFWVTVTDADNTNVINERMRPEGSALVELSGRFVYK